QRAESPEALLRKGRKRDSSREKESFGRAALRKYMIRARSLWAGCVVAVPLRSTCSTRLRGALRVIEWIELPNLSAVPDVASTTPPTEIPKPSLKRKPGPELL